MTMVTDLELSHLLDVNGQNLRAGDHVIEGSGSGLSHRRFVQDDHVLGSTHAIHYVHDGSRQRGHDLIFYRGLRIGLEHGNVKLVVGMLFVQQ